MRNFRTLSQAQKDRDELQNYINLIELYRPTEPKHHAVFQYALKGGLDKASSALNELGIDNDGFPFTPESTKELLLVTPSKGDDLHKQVRKLFLKRGLPARREAKFL